MLGDSENRSRGHVSSSIMPYDHLEWVPVHSPDSGDDWCRTPSTDDQVYWASPASCHSAVSTDNDPYYNAIRLAVVECELEDVRERERTQTSEIAAREKRISELILGLDKERNKSELLGGKLCDLFVVVTQNQQYELDKVQRQLMNLQLDAENGFWSQAWRNLQQRLHNLNHKLDRYIGLSSSTEIFAGIQTDELTLFLGSLLGNLPKMREEVERLSGYIEEEKAIDTQDKLQADKHAYEHMTREHARQEDDDSAKLRAPFSMTNILNRYYGFSQLHREMMETRKERLQELLDRTSTELSRLQADLAYEEGRTANMRTRMEFWGYGLEGSKAECPFTLLENLEKKRLMLKHGSQELEGIVKTIHQLPSRFHIIDIRDPEEYHASRDPKLAHNEAKESSGNSGRAVIAGQREDTMYIAELEAKLAEKQANEKAWAAHFESLHRQENEAKESLKKQIDSVEVKNKELQKIVTMVTGKLFQRRERLWDLSATARQMGEELISTLGQLGISCDKPQVYENEW
ncbi:hypothetical protein FHL15_008623 [Xylaria flabelliformis]|uniref:Uncharacterized protein n=1 Tax=Xylaria flabelliformis TaxID=2512241 RepID=A0A553HR65_9PEZI|nr:hypothetical protein FHL15_008623 [Xylaria flabelliformis]